MRFRKAVAAKALDLAADLLRKQWTVVALEHAADELLLILLEFALAAPCTHRATQLVCLARGEARGHHGQLHDLLLEDRHPQGTFEHRTDLRPWPFDGQAGVASGACLEIGVDHATLNRSRAHDGHLDHQIVEAAWLETWQHGHLGTRFNLEHADRVSRREHFVDACHLFGDARQVEGAAAPARDQVETAAQRGEHAQRQHVHLEQSQCIEIVLVPLDDGAIRHGGVLDGHQFVEPPAGDHETADMLGQVPWKADQRAYQPEQLRDGGAGRVESGLEKAFRRDRFSVPPEMIARKPLDPVGADAERLADVAQRAARSVGDHRRCQRGTFPSITPVKILDDLLAPLVLEVHVDVGRLVALARNEALDQHDAQRGVDLGDAERPAHRRIGSRSAALAEDAALAGEAHDVVDGEEIGLVSKLSDQCQLVFDQLAHPGGCRIGIGGRTRGRAGGRGRTVLVCPRVTPGQAAFGKLPEPDRGALARRHQFIRVFVTQFVQRETAAGADLEGFGQQLGGVAARQGAPAVQPAFGIGLQGQAGCGDAAAQAHGAQGIGQRAPGGDMHEGSAGRNERQAGRRQRLEPVAIVGLADERGGNPAAPGKALPEPLRVFAESRGLHGA